MKKILITGASGFIGGALVNEAFDKGFEVWVGVRKESSGECLKNPLIHRIHLDYDHLEVLCMQVAGFASQNGSWDYVIHCAGITKCAVASDYDRINFSYSKNLVDALFSTGNAPLKFLYMSSLAACGPGDEKHYAKIRLEDPPRPNSSYGRSKILAEQYIQSFPNFPYIILRPTGVYGPGDRDYYVLMKSVHSGFEFTVGLKPQMLNFIYIKDLVNVCFAALESPLVNKVWFVADGDVYTSDAFTDLLKKVLQKKMVLKIRFPLAVVKVVSLFAGLLCHFTRKPSLIHPDKYQIMKQRNWSCDSSSLEKDLGFKAAYNLKRGLEETVEWYKEKGWL
jgi:nucleoside-diphosphate-sugar epimerase